MTGESNSIKEHTLNISSSQSIDYKLKIVDMIGYLFGHRDSILKVAKNTSTIWYGLFFVFMAGIAREYDQELIRDSFVIYLAPFVASFVMIIWISFWFSVHTKSFKQSIKESKFLMITGLFWMTGPLAFLYAIPVEDIFDSLTAVRINLYLLTLVAIWRVILFARVLHVCTGVNFYAGLISCCSGVSIPALMFSSMSIVGIMSGSALSPEQQILKDYTDAAISTVFVVFLISFPIALVQFINFRGLVSFPVKDQRGRLNFGLIILVFSLGIFGLWKYQDKVQRHVDFNSLVWDKKYLNALDYASQFEKSDFAATRSIVPGRANSHGYYLFNALKSDHDKWLKNEVYRWVEISLSVNWERGRDKGLRVMFNKDNFLPSDLDFFKKNRDRINIVLLSQYEQAIQYNEKDNSIFELYKIFSDMGFLDEKNKQLLTESEESQKL